MAKWETKWEGVGEDKEKLEISDYKFCEDCNVLMDSDINNTLTCRVCGFIKNITTENNEYEPSMNGNNTNNIVEKQIIEICDGQSECIDSWDSLLENSCQISDSEECRKVKLKINELFNGLEDFSVGSGNGNNDEETLIGSSAT